jgi:hypothetical protein
MNVRLPVGAKLTQAYYVVLPFEGASEAAGQVVGRVYEDDFVKARDLAIKNFEQNRARAARTGLVLTNKARPRIVHRFVFEFPEGGGTDIELERDMLTDGMIEAAKQTDEITRSAEANGADPAVVREMLGRVRHSFTDQDV